jgi:hypothetical protein
MAAELKSLDERYLEFRDRTASVFRRFPELELLRFFIFKDLLAGRRVPGLRGTLGHWLRPLRPHHRGSQLAERADLLIWVESPRDVFVETLRAVGLALLRRGFRVAWASYRHIDGFPSSVVPVSPGRKWRPPPWAAEAWASCAEVAPELRDARLRRAFLQQSTATDALLGGMARLIEQVRPRLILNAVSLLAGGAGATITARRMGLESVQLQHGITQPFYTPLLDDWMVTWGSSSTETLRSLGVAPTQLVTLGSPRHDVMIPQRAGAGRLRLLELLNLPDRPTFVFFSNGNDLMRNGKGPAEAASWLEAAARRLPDRINMVVRLHPNEDGSLYRGMAGLRLVKGKPDLATTLEGADAIGSLCSTALYEALLFLKPVLQFDADGWPDLADNWRRGLARRISSAGELESALDALRNGEIDRGDAIALRERVFANHPHAADAVAHWLEERFGVR